MWETPISAIGSRHDFRYTDALQLVSASPRDANTFAFRINGHRSEDVTRQWSVEVPLPRIPPPLMSSRATAELRLITCGGRADQEQRG